MPLLYFYTNLNNAEIYQKWQHALNLYLKLSFQKNLQFWNRTFKQTENFSFYILKKLNRWQLCKKNFAIDNISTLINDSKYMLITIV